MKNNIKCYEVLLQDVIRMIRKLVAKDLVILELLILSILSIFIIKNGIDRNEATYASIYDTTNDYIKWVSFDVKATALDSALRYDIESQTEEVKLNWIELLAYLGAKYGGWRIGIRSFDKKRYYYYAHLRKNFPYNKSLEEGSIVQAGDVIGYMGRTGYSNSENINNIQVSHLHFGIQLIFDESQKESVNEIWIDCYELVKFLYKNRSETVKDIETKEYHRIYQYIDPIAEHYINHQKYKYDDYEFDIHIYE